MSEDCPDDTVYNPTIDVVFGVMELSSSIIGFLLNVFAFSHFFRRRKLPTYFLYMSIVVTDILTCISTFPSAVSMLKQRKPVLLSSGIICMASAFISNITIRMSMFLIAVLSVIRCLTIAPSIPSPKLWHAVLPVAIYLVIQTFQSSLPFLFSNQSPAIYYTNYTGGCGWGINDLSFSEYQTASYTTLTYLFVILPSLLPAFPVIISCIIVVKIILSSKNNLKMYNKAAKTKCGVTDATVSEGNMVTVHVSPPDTRKETPLNPTLAPARDTNKLSLLPLSHSIASSVRRSFGGNQHVTLVSASSSASKRKKSHVDSAQQATKTIYIVTGLYVVFNVPVWIFIIAVLFSASDHLPWFRCHLMYLHIFLNRICVVMNAASNGVVYFARMKDLRKACYDDLKAFIRLIFCKNS